MDVALDIGGIDRHEFGVLSDVATHAGKAHLWTREIQLYGVHTSALGHLGQFNPLFLGLTHDAGNDHLRGVVLLQSVEDVKVHVNGILAQLLHIAETVEVAVDAVAMDGIETWGHLADFLQTDGFVEHAGPSRVEGARHHLVVGAHGRRGEEERILATDAAEVDGQVGIMRVVDIVGADGTDDVTDTDGRIVVNTGPFGGFQISVGTIGNEAEGGLVVVETDGAQCAGRVACRAGLCARCVLA